MNFLKILGKHRNKETNPINNTLITISATINAYARIHINKIKLYILSKGKKLFYLDTNNIVIDLKLGNNIVNVKKFDKLKLEHLIKEGIFITNKTYCLIDSNENFINKAKDIKSSSLKYNDYKKLLNNKSVSTIVKS